MTPKESSSYNFEKDREVTIDSLEQLNQENLFQVIPGLKDLKNIELLLRSALYSKNQLSIKQNLELIISCVESIREDCFKICQEHPATQKNQSDAL